MLGLLTLTSSLCLYRCVAKDLEGSQSSSDGQRLRPKSPPVAEDVAMKTQRSKSQSWALSARAKMPPVAKVGVATKVGALVLPRTEELQCRG